MVVSTPSRARRILGGWSANLILMLLSLMQQLILVPIFLHFWSVETLGAWFAILAAGNLVLIADLGLHVWSLNSFLSFKSSDDCDQQTSSYYGAALRLYFWLAIAFAALILFTAQFFHPSAILRFSNEPNFDLAFLIVTVGTVLSLPSNLASALFRARGLYGRVVGIQCCAVAAAQLGQLIGIVTTGSMLVVASVYLSGQIIYAVYILALDVHRRFPFLREARRAKLSWAWALSQIRNAFPFGVMNITELVLAYAPVLLISVFVTDRALVAQWGLVRTIASLLKGICFQMSLPLAAELGHDHATGMTEQLASLYSRGSLLLTLLASVVTSGAVVFWSDFFVIWTHGSVPDDPTLVMIFLIGTCIAAPSALAFSYANYSNRGYLLLWTKTLQVGIFLVLSLVLIPRIGLLGAAIALISCDILVQYGMLSSIIGWETLKNPWRHALISIGVMAVVLVIGVQAGVAAKLVAPATGLVHFLLECLLWLGIMGIAAAPLASAKVRNRLAAVAS